MTTSSTPGPVVAVDGPAGSGKSTVAKLVADRLGVPHLDTGALYRAVTLACLRDGLELSDAEACGAVAAEVTIETDEDGTWLDGELVEQEIRGPQVTEAVSTVSAHPQVREAMVPVQRYGARLGAVAEGRDMGTVVFPDADLKVFLTASVEERARRRAAQVGIEDVAAVAADIERRDAADSSRELAPLAEAEDAWLLDTTGMSIDEVVEAIAEEARRRTRRRTRAELPRVAVVGRPNVGKSTLVNRILGRRVTIVEEKPGVTRDRTEHVAEWTGRHFMIVDTGGWHHDAEGLDRQVVQQAEAAATSADLVLFVVDITVGIQEDDERYAKMLRRTGTPVMLVANKADADRHEQDAYEFYDLGLGDPLPVSAAHGRRVGDLLDDVVSALPEDDTGRPPDEDHITRVAIVGKPNVGKSSLLNRLLGEERVIVDDVPHTTRDAIDTLVELDGEPWRLVDTAGLRRKYRTGEDTELYSVDRTRMAIEQSDLVLFLIDGSEQIAEQDQRLAALVRDAGRGVVIVVNKWDMVDEDRRRFLEKELDRLLSFASWAPRVNISALKGRNVTRLVDHLRAVRDGYLRRIPTRELNRWLEGVTERTAPPMHRHRPVRVRYITQVEVGPPTFLVFTNGPLPDAYVRYLERELRTAYGFVGAPLRLEVRRGRRDRRG